jgi:DNA-binding NarL/FixJ family response regulator
MNRALRLVIVEGPLAQLQGLLELEGFAVAPFARRGGELLSLVGRHRPDAILLDLDQSELSPTTAIRRLAERFPEIPTIVLGDSVSSDDIATAFEAGARAYIVKTGELDHLGDTVRRAIGVGHPEAALDSSDSTSSGDPVWIPGEEQRRLRHRRTGTDRRTRAAATPISFERRTGTDRRLSARRHNDPRLEPAT